MNFHVLTLFPEMIENGMNTSITGRAITKGLLTLEAVNIRDYAFNKHQKVDDYTYGGGAGMLMQAEPVYLAYEAIANRTAKKPRVVYLTPQGQVFNQAMAREMAQEEDLVFLCGHYEGIDERVLEEIVTDYVSIGDYVLTGGELPAMVMMDSISRMVPGVLNNQESGETESFAGNLLEYPQYSRPVTTRIYAWNQRLSFCHRIRFQCPIDLLLCVLTADPIPFGGIARDRLIPQPQDPCGSILVPKVRMRIIHARIDTGNQNPFTKQIRRLILDRIHTGSLPAFICSKIQSLRCFDILYRRILCKPFDLILWNICNSIISKKGCNNNLIRLKLRCRPEVTNDQLPPLCVFFIPCVQIHRCFPFPGCGIESKI